MPRDVVSLLDDMLSAIAEIFDFLKDTPSVGEYSKDILRKRAVERNLEVIGEIVKKIPEDLKNTNSDIQWRQIAGLRDFIAHGYFEIDDDIIWNAVKNHLPDLQIRILEIRGKLTS